MVDYLNRIGAGLIIAHPERLDFDFVPEELVGREETQRELASKFSNVAAPEGAARAVITGPVGSGKTVLAKTFCRDLQRHLSGKRELKVAHINCRNASTSMRVAQRILHQFDPGHVSIGCSQIAFPTIVLPKDDHTDLAQEERLGLPYWTMILAICVVVDESKCLDTPILEFFIICDHIPFSLGYKLILRLLLVHRNQAIWR